MHRGIVLFLLFPLFLTACGGGSNNNNTDPPSASIAGNWQMSLQPESVTTSTRAQSGFILQNGNTLTGQLFLLNPPCSGTSNVSGSIAGSSVSLALNPTGISVSLSGTVGSSPNSMSGNYSILSMGCTGNNASPANGTWTANLVTPVSGNFQGTFTHSSTPYSATGTITQGPNTGSLNATLTGTLSITGYCFTSANIAGGVSGTSAVMNLLDSNGNQIGAIEGTTSLDGSSMTGTFTYNGQGSTGVPGCRAAQGGPVCLVWQASGQTNCSTTSSDLSDPK
jgi:hypothetical protein